MKTKSSGTKGKSSVHQGDENQKQQYQREKWCSAGG